MSCERLSSSYCPLNWGKSNQAVLVVSQEVHNSYLDLQGAEQLIDITTENVIASKEALRLAYRRLQLGNGTNLELIQAQQNYVEALNKQIRAYIDHRNAQAQLLRSAGTISLVTLLAKYTSPNNSSP